MLALEEGWKLTGERDAADQDAEVGCCQTQRRHRVGIALQHDGGGRHDGSEADDRVQRRDGLGESHGGDAAPDGQAGNTAHGRESGHLGELLLGETDREDSSYHANEDAEDAQGVAEARSNLLSAVYCTR